MTAISLLISLLIPFLTGYLLVSLFWPEKEPLILILLKSFLAVGAGFGVCSSLFFVWSLVFNPSNKGFILLEITLLTSLTVVYLYQWRRRSGLKPAVKKVSKLRISWVLTAGFWLCFFSAAGIFVLLTLNNPHGSWDTWAIWNMRARFIFRGGGYWKETFSPLITWSHPDYPLLLPGVISQTWRWIGAEVRIVPVLIAGLFTLAVGGLLVSSLSLLRSKAQGVLAGIVLLGTPFFVRHGASQYADVPLAFFILATFVLLFFQSRAVKKRGLLLVLAGLMAGFSAWTKNEGLLFLVSFVIAFWAVVLAGRGPKFFLKQFFSLMLGVLPILIIIIYFRAKVVPSIETVLPQDTQTVYEKLLDFSRYLQVLKAFGRQVLNFGDGIVGIVPLLGGYFFLSGAKIDVKDKISLVISLITLGLILSGLFIFYVITPEDLHWLLSTSLDRLLLQLWPSALFIYFMIVSPIKR